MFKIAFDDTVPHYLPIDMKDRRTIIGALTGFLTFFVMVKANAQNDVFIYLIGVFAAVFSIGVVPLSEYVINLIKRLIRVGYLEFWVSDNYGGFDSEGYANLHVENIDRLNFNHCHATFSKIQSVGANSKLDLSNAGNIGWVNTGDSPRGAEYLNIKSNHGKGVLYFARTEKDNSLTFFSTGGDLGTYDYGIYDFDIVFKGICTELNRDIRPMKFKGRLSFQNNSQTWLISKRKA